MSEPVPTPDVIAPTAPVPLPEATPPPVEPPVGTSVAAGSRRRLSIDLVRRVGFAVLAAAALVVFLVGGPSDPDVTDHRASVASIEARDSANNARTEGAPQQQVVNGWTTIEFLGHIADQVDELPGRLAPTHDGRPAALLLIGVLTATFHLGTKQTVTKT